ncbi:MAG: hypothetical protein JNM36_15160 [Chitinophagales bacterium]|nr:hypothetical protein [Chitinophagales bacterium]
MIDNAQYSTMDKTLKRRYNIIELLGNTILLIFDDYLHNSQIPKLLGLEPKLLGLEPKSLGLEPKILRGWT